MKQFKSNNSEPHLIRQSSSAYLVVLIELKNTPKREQYFTQANIYCLKSTIETLEKGMKYVQS